MKKNLSIFCLFFFLTSCSDDESKLDPLFRQKVQNLFSGSYKECGELEWRLGGFKKAIRSSDDTLPTMVRVSTQDNGANSKGYSYSDNLSGDRFLCSSVADFFGVFNLNKAHIVHGFDKNEISNVQENRTSNYNLLPRQSWLVVKSYNDETVIPIQVSCISPWKISPMSTYKDRVIITAGLIEEPAERCYFFVENQILNINGRGVIVSLKGYHEPNPESENETLVKIQKFAYRLN